MSFMNVRKRAPSARSGASRRIVVFNRDCRGTVEMLAQRPRDLIWMAVVLERQRPKSFVVLNNELRAVRLFKKCRRCQFAYRCAGSLCGAGSGFDGSVHRGTCLRPQMRAHETDARRRGRAAIDAQIATGDGGRCERDIGYSGGVKADGVEMPGQTFHADSGDQPVRRLEARNAAKGRWTYDRARRLTAERNRHHPGGDGRCRTRRRATRRMRKITRIARAGRHHKGKLGRHRLAEDQTAGAAHQ